MLAVERGMDGFIVDDVVQQAGYSRRTFANYFSCKEEAVAAYFMGGGSNEDAKMQFAGFLRMPLRLMHCTTC